MTTPPRRGFVALLALTAGFDGVRAGASVFRGLLDFPARNGIGPVAFAELSRATDLSTRGVVFYAAFGLLGLALTATTAALAWRWRVGADVRWLTTAAAVSSLAIMAFTIPAAPLMWKVGSSPNDPAVLTALIEPFVAWSYARLALACVSFIATLTALAKQASAT